MDWIQDNIFSIISLVILLLGFAFNFGAFHTQMKSLNTNLKERRATVDDKIKEVEARIATLENKSGQWERLDEKVSQISKTLDALVSKVDQFLMGNQKK
jgi:predicted  nucleic acid-binding Zn-ribbon protein